LAIGAVALTLMGYRRYATERARAAAVVAREREQLRVTLLGIGDAVIVVDRFSHVTLMNPVAEAITGWTMADAIDKPIGSVFRIVNEETRREVHNPIAVVLETGATQGLANHTLLIARDGVERPVDDSAAPLRDASGDLVGAVLVFRDVSARRADEKRLHRALEEAGESKAIAETRQQDLEEALQIKNQFLAAVSHELRTPINAIMGWSAMLRQGTVSAARIGGAIASLDRSARDLGKLIEDLLESSRLLTGKVRIARDAVDLHEVALDAVDSVRLGAENKGVVLDLDIAAVPPVRGDRERLKQVLWNVLGNAIKFTPRDGHVSLAMVAGGDDVKVTISDTGVGISESLLPHVFEHFRQGDEGAGLGLGLAIARQVIEMHGGTIEAQSGGPHLGSTFVICLPIATADNAEAADQALS
jgi:PAS domain S-box-containing protein